MVILLKTILKNVENEFIIKNSRFITLLFKIENDNITSYLNYAKEKYPKATHYCYAYIYNDYKKASDDNEPSNTAGSPMLNVLEKEKLNHVLAITVRYFGGIKLGAGGLIRAYSKSVTEALKLAQYKELEKGYKIKITFNYNQEKQIDYILNNAQIISKEFSEDITYIALINKSTLDKLNDYNFEIIENNLIKKA